MLISTRLFIRPSCFTLVLRKSTVSVNRNIYHVSRCWFPGRRHFSDDKPVSHDVKTSDTTRNQHRREQLAFLEATLHRIAKFQNDYTWRGKLMVASTVMLLICAVVYLYSYRDEMRIMMADEVSHVASRSLEDDKLLSNAEQLSKDVLNNILHDDSMKESAAVFLTDVITSAGTKEAITLLLLSVLNDQRIFNKVAEKLRSILLDILHSDDTRDVVKVQVEKILEDESVKNALENLLSDVTATPKVRQTLSDFFREVLASKTVTEQGSQLGKEITSNVIGDRAVQQQAGDAIWSAVKYSIIPKRLQSNNNNDEKEPIHALKT
ncbi:uncharacterized protein LOC143445330 [Clavelina lepadiformis]|uniref:uncharacterized protein LOC143445330 n=1 Tax=Clavelina lepadiformis TaxID=159417 RepID=UPI004043817E